MKNIFLTIKPSGTDRVLDRFCPKMKNRSTILEELKEISSVLIDIQPLNPYTLPRGYFENFPGLLKDRLKTSDPDQFLDRQVAQPFGVPENYFDGLAGNILARIKAEEKNPEISLPVNFPKTNPYTVPAGYFEEFSSSVLASLQPEKGARVVQGNFRRNFLRVAAAAVLGGIIFLSVFLYQQDKPGITDSTLSKIDQVPLQELERYMDGQAAELPVGTLYTNEEEFASGELDAEDMKEFLSDIPDEALMQYLNLNSTVVPDNYN